jgi:isoamylase
MWRMRFEAIQARHVQRPTRNLQVVPAHSVLVRGGLAHPRGATWTGEGVNFALFSAHATKVELCLIDEAGEDELQRIELPEFMNEIGHGYMKDLTPGTVYGFRVPGPYAPAQSHRFNPNKLLLDPYARSHIGALKASA